MSTTKYASKAEGAAGNSGLRIRVVSFKTCIVNSAPQLSTSANNSDLFQGSHQDPMTDTLPPPRRLSPPFVQHASRLLGLAALF